AVVAGAEGDPSGVALRPQTLRLCKTADAILVGAVGGPKGDEAAPDSKLRPGSALLGLRKGLGLFANLRPVRVDPAMVATSALRPERVRDVDLLVVRELTGGLYFSKPKRRYETPRGQAAVDTMRYSTPEIERVAVRACSPRRASVAGRSGCTSRSTARPPISPGRASPTRSARFSVRPSSCAGP